MYYNVRYILSSWYMYYCKIYSYKCHVPYLKGGFSLIGLPEGMSCTKLLSEIMKIWKENVRQ